VHSRDELYSNGQNENHFDTPVNIEEPLKHSVSGKIIRK